MKENPHVGVYPSDATGCGMYRMIWPGEAVAATGKPVNVLHRPPEIVVDEKTGMLFNVLSGTIDVMVLQRPASQQVQQLISIVQKRGRKVILDMDDSMSLIPPKNPSFKTYDPRENHQRNWMHAAKACEMADLVTVTTEALAEEYGKHGRVAIIPNHIPKANLAIPRQEREVPVVGWAGWTVMHPDDLYATSGMINQVLADTKAKFMAYGDLAIFNQMQIRNRPPHEHQDFTDIYKYPKNLASMDIGLVPLAKTKFNEAKSWLKGLEYASVGVVPVVTPIGDYMNLIDMGAAIPASTPREWYDRVRELILDHEMRRELSKKVREIASAWTIEDNTHKWWNAWDGCYRNVL